MRDCAAYDPLRAETVRDPYPIYAQLRAIGRLLWHERLGAWLVPHYHDCVNAFRAPQLYASDPRRIGAALPESAVSIQTSDPPEHTAVREVLADGFRALGMTCVDRSAGITASQLASRLARDGHGDLMHDFAIPLASRTICDFLGVPAPDPATLQPISDAIIAGMDAGLDPARDEPAQRARAQLSALVASWFPAARHDRLVGLVEQRRGELPATVLHNSLRVVFHAGLTSVYSALGNAMHTILRERLPWRPFGDAATAATAVEELLRFDGPVQVNSRVAVEDVSFADGRVRRGDSLLLLLGSANRDAHVFERADEIVLDRTPNKHLALGVGIHQCLGGTFARRVLRVALAELATAFSELRIDGEIEHKPQATQRCVDRLPVSCTGARRAQQVTIA